MLLMLLLLSSHQKPFRSQHHLCNVRLSDICLVPNPLAQMPESSFERRTCICAYKCEIVLSFDVKRANYRVRHVRVDSVNSSLRVLEESCLVPFLQQLLENDSLLDVDRHAALYTSVFKVTDLTCWDILGRIRVPSEP